MWMQTQLLCVSARTKQRRKGERERAQRGPHCNRLDNRLCESEETGDYSQWGVARAVCELDAGW